MAWEKIVLLTGATSGIGRQAARELVGRGFRVVAVARDRTKAEALVAELGRDRVSYLLADLSRPAEAAEMARQFMAQHDRLDVLFNNAGALFVDRKLTSDGLERTFALNHLGYFVPTVLLLDRLRASAPARIVSTSSGAHRSGDLGYLDDLQTERWGLSGMRAYGRSKLANIWFTVELARRLEGSGVTANCFHPGFVASEFGRNTGILAKLAMIASRPIQRTVEQGADTGVYLATDPELKDETGGYWFDRIRRRGSADARDPHAPARLWQESERIVADLLGDDWTQPATPAAATTST